MDPYRAGYQGFLRRDPQTGLYSDGPPQQQQYTPIPMTYNEPVLGQDYPRFPPFLGGPYGSFDAAAAPFIAQSPRYRAPFTAHYHATSNRPIAPATTMQPVNLDLVWSGAATTAQSANATPELTVSPATEPSIFGTPTTPIHWQQSLGYPRDLVSLDNTLCDFATSLPVDDYHVPIWHPEDGVIGRQQPTENVVHQPQDAPSVQDQGEEQVHDDDDGKCYAKILADALRAAPNRIMKLQDLYDYVEQHSKQAREASTQGWKNSVRHNLSMNAAFESWPPRATRTGRNKKTSQWRMTDAALATGVLSTTRYRKALNNPRRRSVRSSPAPKRQESGAKGGRATRAAAAARLRRGEQQTTRSTATPPQQSLPPRMQQNSPGDLDSFVVGPPSPVPELLAYDGQSEGQDYTMSGALPAVNHEPYDHVGMAFNQPVLLAATPASGFDSTFGLPSDGQLWEIDRPDWDNLSGFQ